MIYLVGQLWLFLFLAAAFAAFAGWSWAGQRVIASENALRRERENLVRDLIRLGVGGNDRPDVGGERESDAMRRLVEIRDGRITELEHALEAARARADDAASRLAASERSSPASVAENEELSHLRALAARHETERAREIEVAEEVAEDDSVMLQAWRLRYFEQRVRYLEAAAPAPLPAPPVAAPPPIAEWRVREAQARAAHLEHELRTLSAPSPESSDSPFAANAEVDVLLRWRLLYLERRVAYLQGKAATPAVDPESDRWKWRTRYLEARVRHLEATPSAPAPALLDTAPGVGVEQPTEPAARSEKPNVLAAARNGAPDDFTLIEEVSVLQQTTLYSIGVFHFDQIAAWTPANVAWVDQYLRLRGRVDDEEWVEQACDLSLGGVDAARRTLAEEDA